MNRSLSDIDKETARKNKDDLIRKIAEVDREIAMAQSQITNLKRKQQDLETTATSKDMSVKRCKATEGSYKSVANNIYLESRIEPDREMSRGPMAGQRK